MTKIKRKQKPAGASEAPQPKPAPRKRAKRAGKANKNGLGDFLERTAMVNVEDLVPDPGNPRTISKPQFRQLCNNIKEFGWTEPLLIRRSDNLIISGHQRLKAAIKLRINAVPCVHVDFTDEQVKVANLAQNRIGGEFDLEAMVSYLDGIGETLDARMTGFTYSELDGMLDTVIASDDLLDEIFKDNEENFAAFEDDFITGHDDERESEKNESEAFKFGQMDFRIRGSLYYRFSRAWLRIKEELSTRSDNEVMKALLNKIEV